MHNKLSTFFSLPQLVNLHFGVSNNDIHRDLGGIWGKKVCVIIMACAAYGAILDARILSFPPFPGLRSFTAGITSAKWVDAGTYGELHKVFIASALGTIGDHEDLHLMLARHWATLSHFDGLHVQTTESLAEIQNIISRLGKLMMRVHQLFGENIDYPKLHVLVHLGLRYKKHGSSKTTSTRVGEVLHKEDHFFYRTTNKHYSTILDQLTRHHQQDSILTKIQGKRERLEMPDLTETTVSRFSSSSEPLPITLTKRSKERRLKSIIDLNKQSNPAVWTRVAWKLQVLLTDPRLLRNEVDLNGIQLKYPGTEKKHSVFKHTLIRIPYLSIKTRNYAYDLIRCNPDCYGKERFDCIIFQDPSQPAGAKPSFGRIIKILSIQTKPEEPSHFENQVLVQEYSYTGRHPTTLMPTLKKQDHSIFIFAKDIIRAISLPSVPLTPISPQPKKSSQLSTADYFANEMIDCDMYHRMNRLFPLDPALAQSFYDKLDLDIDTHIGDEPLLPEIARQVQEQPEDGEDMEDDQQVSGRAGAEGDGEEDIDISAMAGLSLWGMTRVEQTDF